MVRSILKQMIVVCGFLSCLQVAGEAKAYYAQAQGRFISRDPIGYVDGQNLYTGYFAPNDTDPTGLIKVECTFKGHLWGEKKVSVSCNGLHVEQQHPEKCCQKVDPGIGWVLTDWKPEGGGNDNIGASLCDRVDFTDMDYYGDCFSCCVAKLRTGGTAIGTAVAARPPIIKGVWYHGQFHTTSYWTKLCVRYSHSKYLTKSVRILGKSSPWMIIAGGAVDSYVMYECHNICSDKPIY